MHCFISEAQAAPVLISDGQSYFTWSEGWWPLKQEAVSYSPVTSESSKVERNDGGLAVWQALFRIYQINRVNSCNDKLLFDL